MNEQDKELALRIACEGGIKDSFEFAHRYHTAKLEQYGKGFEDVRSNWISSEQKNIADCDAERSFFYQAGAARSEAEVVALREEVERLKAYAAHERSLGAEVGMLAANNAKHELLTAQLDNRRKTELLQWIHDVMPTCTDVREVNNFISKLEAALSTSTAPINTTEIDALVKALENLATCDDAGICDDGFSAGYVAKKALAAIKESGVDRG